MGLEGFLLSQVINLLEGEGYGRNPKSQRYLSQLKAIHFLLSLMIKESSEALEVVLKGKGLDLRSDSQLEVYRSGNEITLYLFNVECHIVFTPKAKTKTAFWGDYETMGCNIS